MPAPTDVAGLITGDNYDAVVPVTSDTSVFTEAEHTNTIVSLGNRIHYILRRTPDLALAPEQLYSFREDFDAGFIDTVNTDLHFNRHWKYGIIGPGSLSFSSGQGKNPGNLDFAVGGGVLQQIAAFAISQTGQLINFSNLEQFTAVMKVTDNPANNTASIRVSIEDQTGFSDYVAFEYTSLDHANWKVHTRKTTGSVDTSTSIGAVTSGSYVVLDLLKNSSGNWKVHFNGATVATIVPGSFPDGAGVPQIVCGIGAADAGNLLASVDFVYVRATIPTRSGP